MSEIKTEQKQSKDEDVRKTGLKNLDVRTLNDMIAHTADDEQWAELKTVMIDYIIAYNLDLKYFK